tara:strand:- start:126 stop:428 length:303 start_codon:yes stop_codon:yes gene_type:complete
MVPWSGYAPGTRKPINADYRALTTKQKNAAMKTSNSNLVSFFNELNEHNAQLRSQGMKANAELKKVTKELKKVQLNTKNVNNELKKVTRELNKVKLNNKN